MNSTVEVFLASLVEEKTCKKRFAERSGIHPSRITNMLQGRQIGSDLLIALSHNWDNPETGKRILIAHLRDEIERAGHTVDDFQIELKAQGDDPDLTSALQVLDKVIHHKQDIRENIIELARMLQPYVK